jgi:hypothetical protein
VAAVAAIAIPIGVAGPHLGSSSSNSSAGVDAGGGGGGRVRKPAPAEPAPPAAVRAAAQSAADAPGATVSGPVRWVQTRLSRIWALEPPNRGIKPADRAVYVIALTGRFRCTDCNLPAGPGHYSPPTVTSERIIVPVTPRAGDRSPTAAQGESYDLTKLGDVHTFTLR